MTDVNHKLDTDRRVFFYEQDFYVLSNFSAFNLQWCGHTFMTCEHAYHWAKFVGTGFESGMEGILNAPSAHQAFKLAQVWRPYVRGDWESIKVDVMRKLLFLKCEQHEYVRRKLLSTGERELIEDSWRDGFWGWGETRDGLNMLGKLWMEVRATLKAAK